MNTTGSTLERVARTVALLLFGAAGTAGVAVALLAVTQPLRVRIYDALYLAVGPWTATTAATVLAFTFASLAAVCVPTLVAAYARSRFEHLRSLGAVLAGALLLAVLILLVTAYAGVVGFLPAIVAVAAFVVAVPVGSLVLGAWHDGLAAFAGGIPVLVLLLFLLGFGLGWGGGYDVVATELPPSTVEGSADATFDDAPALRDALLTPDGDDVYATCERDDDDRRTCRLSLRGYDDEAAAARFLDRHGVRCPFLDGRGATEGSKNRSFVAEEDGAYYRVTCVAYGD